MDAAVWVGIVGAAGAVVGAGLTTLGSYLTTRANTKATRLQLEGAREAQRLELKQDLLLETLRIEATRADAWRETKLERMQAFDYAAEAMTNHLDLLLKSESENLSGFQSNGPSGQPEPSIEALQASLHRALLGLELIAGNTAIASAREFSRLADEHPLRLGTTLDTAAVDALCEARSLWHALEAYRRSARFDLGTAEREAHA